MKTRTLFQHIALVLGFGGLLGCTPVQRDGDPMVREMNVSDQAQLDDILMACEDVLRDQGFRLDRVDRRAGVVTTHPETSQHFFEVWRKDVATAYDFWEASLNTIRRTVEITTQPDLMKGNARLTVKVIRERYSAPERQFNNSIAAFQFYGTTLPSVETGETLTAADNEWIPDGRDLTMEAAILNKITARTG